MPNPITAADLAEALRLLLVASKRDVDASTNARCIRPETDTVWPDGYDFEALEEADDEEIDARRLLLEQFVDAESLLARYDVQQAEEQKLAAAVNATGLARVYIVELEDGCWLTDGDGDPPRTLVMAHAKFFGTRVRAARALVDARKYRPFRNATIVALESR